MFKSKQEIIVMQAESVKQIDSGVVFWSHDKGTAKLVFNLKKDEINQTLAEGTIVPVLLEFNSSTAENSRGRHIYHAVIEDAVNGIVSIVLEDNILGYQGRVDGSIYIELPDSRSLDTAGRFTFHIKRSPIDEDVPELEDYYWQGFGEIMEQYHESIAEIKSEAKVLLDSLTADVTTAQNKVSTLEQNITTANTNLNARIDEINKKIDDNDVFTKAESSANVIYQIIGKEEVEITLTLDLNGKIAGSTIEKPHKSCIKTASQEIITSNGAWVDRTQADYDNLYANDSKIARTLTRTDLTIAQSLLDYDLVSGIENYLGENFFKGLGAEDTVQKASVIKRIVTKLKSSVFGYGSSPTGNLLSHKLYYVTGMPESGVATNSTSTIQEVQRGVTDHTSLINRIGDDGHVYGVAFAEKSDGTTASSISIDYACLEVKFKVSVHEFIESMIATNHRENLATQDESEAGTDNTKAMTPLGTAQAIDHRAVTLASNQTVGGIKNFKDGLMLNDTSVVADQYVEKVVVTTNTTDFTADSTVYFQRWGRMVVANVSITNKSANFAAWKTLMQFPNGYSPTRLAGWGGMLTNITTRATALSVYANASGIMVMSSSTDFLASQNCVGTIAYFTSDAWPS